MAVYRYTTSDGAVYVPADSEREARQILQSTVELEGNWSCWGSFDDAEANL